jgi:hypothetical protein
MPFIKVKAFECGSHSPEGEMSKTPTIMYLNESEILAIVDDKVSFKNNGQKQVISGKFYTAFEVFDKKLFQ